MLRSRNFIGNSAKFTKLQKLNEIVNKNIDKNRLKKLVKYLSITTWIGETIYCKMREIYNIFRTAKVEKKISLNRFLPFSLTLPLFLSFSRYRSRWCDERADAQDLIPKVIPNKQTCMKLAPHFFFFYFALFLRCVTFLCRIKPQFSNRYIFSIIYWYICIVSHCLVRKIFRLLTL